MPAYPPRYTQLQVVQPNQQFGKTMAPAVGWDASANDDVVQMWLGTGPQLDGLGHMGEAGMFYNCNRGEDFAEITGLTRLDTSQVPPIVARGVLIDMAKHLGVASLDAGQPITSAQLKEAMAAQSITVGSGDVILIHTGWTDATLKSKPELWGSTIPGITNEAAVFLAAFEPVAVGADTWGLGAVPPIEGDRVFYDHVVLLKDNGIYILETMNTGRLARESVSEFMFVLGQARLKGAVQMIINPVAMW
jgi:kynurenine formamidase